MIALCLFCFSRPLLYTVIAVHMGRTYGFATFGSVYGLAFTVAGIANSLQYLLDEAVHQRYDGDFTAVNFYLTVLQVCTGALPLYLSMSSRRQLRASYK